MSFRSILERQLVPTDEIDTAVKNIRKGCIIGLIPAIIGLFAPLLMALVIPFVRRDANNLPKLFAWFDNNISINGDGWGTICNDGRVLNYTDQDIISASLGRSVSYSDPEYTGDAYYAKGHHPRSRWARYIWLGWRNRASALSMKLGGKFLPTDELRLWGVMSPGGDTPGTMVMNRGNLWQIKDSKIVFFGLLVRNRNFGYKVNNTNSEPNSPAMCIFIPISFKGRKKK